MSRFELSRLALVMVFLTLVAVLAAGVWRYGYKQALDSVAERGRADLALASDRVALQLQRYRELAVLMADHPVVGALGQGAAPTGANKLFQGVADKTSALDVLFVDTSGVVLAASSGTEGRDLSGQPFVARAMTGALGAGHGVDEALGQRASYFAAPHFGVDGSVRGAVVVVADVNEIEWDWTGSNPAVFFTDQDGQVFITNRSELTFWTRPAGQPGLVPPSGNARDFSASYVQSHEIWRLRWGPYLPERAMHIVRELPVIGLMGEALMDVAPARRIALLQAAAVAALCLAFGAMLFLATERRRTLAQANAKLEARVADRTAALSETNTALRHEIRDRREAEAALRRAQEELVQAGKLSALGQMSAGISHELNQPLMAIQSFAENAVAFIERGKPEAAGQNLNRIADLSRRMGRIIRNLRSFARNESEPSGRVDIVAVVQSAVELTEARLDRDQVDLHWMPPGYPIWVRGGEVRLAQVFVNLINNAADAMLDQNERKIKISISEGGPLVVSVADIGPGLSEPEKIFEPFYTTKSVGHAEDGMGLGLSISYGLVQSFGGRIRGENAEQGAVFLVELDAWTGGAEQAA